MTLRQVAEAANVSIKTVSRVLTGDGYASAKTREQVMQAAQAVGYVPNRAARMMRSGEAQIVGLIAPMVTSSPFTTDILRAVGTVVEGAGRALLIADTGAGDAAEPLRLFREFRAEPVIFAASWHQSAEGIFDPQGRRAVLINCFLDRPEVTSFVPDDEGGGYAQAAHLIGLGHQRIGIIELPPGMIARDLRARGVCRAFAEAGVEWDPRLVRAGQTGPREARQTVAYEAALDLLSRPDRPTALLCSKDEFALQAYGAAAALGLRIPDDLSVIGFDDVAVIAGNVRPTLTTVRLPYYEMGRVAALAAMGIDGPGEGRHVVPCPLVQRQSCRAI